MTAGEKQSGIRFKDVSAILGTWVGIVSAILGGYFAINAYQADIKQRQADSEKAIDQRVQNAFMLVEKFHDSQFVSMRTKLVEAFRQGAHCRYFVDPSPISVQEAFTVVEYFDRANACVAAGLCDEATIRQGLGSYATWWAPALRAQIEKTRKEEAGVTGSENYGVGIQKLASAPPATSFPQCPPTPVLPVADSSLAADR